VRFTCLRPLISLHFVSDSAAAAAAVRCPRPAGRDGVNGSVRRRAGLLRL